MKKTIIINISGIIFHIEEDGYEKLKNYLASIQRYFSTYEDNKEIIADIESRIAEIFLSKLSPGKQVITLEDVDMLIVKMGNIADFEAIEEIDVHAHTHATRNTADTGNTTSSATSEPYVATPPKKLYRDVNRKLVGGVAAGIAHYFSIDPLWIRLLFLGALVDLFFFPGSLSSVSFITYVVLWIVVPGSTTLVEDKGVKKLYRNPDKKTIGGVASGIAAYFGTDETVIRLLFVFSLLFFGTGILLYIILWAITPEAKTITEKMQMQGEPVTLSNIESNIKKNFSPNETGEESTLVKVLLFPFRLIATVFSGLSKALGPIALFILDVIRIGVGALLVIISVALVISLITGTAVGLGFITSYAFPHFGNLPVELFQESFPAIGLVAIFVVLLIPALLLGQLGTSLIAKKNIIRAPIGWTLFSIWILALIVTGVTVPVFAGQFRSRGSFENTRLFETNARTLYLNLREAGDENFHNTKLSFEGYEGAVPKLVQVFEARGRNRQDAIVNAGAIQYAVTQNDSIITFDSNFDFKENAKFRGQSIDMVLYIPYEKQFVVDEDLQQIMHWFDYRGKDKIWKFVKDEGLVCLNCPEGEITSTADGSVREFRLKDFDRLNIGSAFLINVEKGDQYKVVISGDREDIEDVDAVVENRELVVDIDQDFPDWRLNRERIRVNITMPVLSGINFHGASESTVRGFDGRDNLEIQLSGAARSVVNVDAIRVSVDLNGASNLELKGRADILEAEVSSAAKLEAYNCIAQDVEIEVNSSGLAEVYASQSLNAEANSAGRVRYRGEANVRSNISSAGSVSKE